MAYKLRFQILLPTFYNDGNPVELDKFLQTIDDLADRFGGLTHTSTDSPIFEGYFLYEGQVYQDKNILIIIDIDDTIENIEYLLSYKYILEERFEQIEIYIVFYPIYKLDEEFLASLRSRVRL